ncbi:MAG: hypothetical protein OWQ48_00445 [Desulfurococcus sp.]|nr:hypothetical protein [Desulfurococcus sp.]
MEATGGYISQLLEFLSSKDFHGGSLSIVPVLTSPWSTATVVNRLSEELGVLDFVVLTRRELVDDVYRSLNRELFRDINVYVDNAVYRSILRDSVFENSIILAHLVKGVGEKARSIYVDLTLTTGSFAITLREALDRQGSSPLVTYTFVDVVPLPELPQYPGSPRWMHKVYIYDNTARAGALSPSVDYSLPGMLSYTQPAGGKIQWRGSLGIFESISRLVNSLAATRIAERLGGESRVDVSGESPVLSVNAVNPVSGERKKMVSFKVSEGLNEDSVNMLMSNWKHLVDIVHENHPDIDKSLIERVLMQFQRYTGAVDLIAREVEGSEARDFEGWKIHSLLIELYKKLGKPVALLPDTNMFYQGLHMVLLKASIRSGRPWGPIEGVRIYIPVCAEAEINGKVAEVSSGATGVLRYSYIMALLANRAADEIKQRYRGVHIPAVSQPCEASIVVAKHVLSEEIVVLVTADKKAFNAWVTLNACRDKTICVYVGHRNKPLNIDGLYSKLYASIVLANQVYVAASITPVEITLGERRLRVMLESLEGMGAPVLSVVEEPVKRS